MVTAEEPFEARESEAPAPQRIRTLVRDYERVAERGVKRLRDLEAYAGKDQALSAAVARLAAAGLVAQQSGAIVLRRPDDCPIDCDEAVREGLQRAYARWLRADAGDGSNVGADAWCAEDELLYGEIGFWQHWWNRVRDRDHASQGPLTMDIVVPDDGSFTVRRWLEEFDPEIRAFALSGSVLRGRAIVPPQALGSMVEPMLDLSTESGIEVRVLSTDARVVLYDSTTAVLAVAPGETHEHGDGVGAHDDGAALAIADHAEEALLEPYRAVRNRAIVEPLRVLFETLWRSAAPFSAYRSEQHSILALLSKGCTDAQIAAALSISPRSVSRRVSEVMAAHGANSRFELGVIYGRYTS